MAQRFHTQTKEIFWLQFLQLQAPAALPVHRLIGHAMGERLARMLRRFCIERDACMHIKREREHAERDACKEREMCMQRDGERGVRGHENKCLQANRSHAHAESI